MRVFLAAFVIQHEMRMLCVILSMACQSIQYFSTLFRKRHDCRNKDTEHKICVFILLKLFSNILPF
jgi:hypothetical protein